MNSSEVSSLIEQYKLTQNEKLEVASKIYADLTHGKKQSTNPTAIIVAGQPGAGKTNLANLTENQFPGAIILDIDNFRQYHPQFQNIKTNHPEHFASLTNKFISEMSAIVSDWLMNSGFDLILHKTFKTEDVIYDTIEPLKMNGYNVVIRSLAVNNLESKISAMERSQFEREVYGLCRFINFDLHDSAYNGLPNIVENLESYVLVDASQVYVRGHILRDPILIYSNVLTGEQKSPYVIPFNLDGYTSSKDAINKGRKMRAADLQKYYPARLKALKLNAATFEEIELLKKLEQQCTAANIQMLSTQNRPTFSQPNVALQPQ